MPSCSSLHLNNVTFKPTTALPHSALLNMYSRITVVFLLMMTMLSSRSVLGQSDKVTQELDAYWAEMARALNEGDHEAMVQLYHPDAIWEGGSGDSLMISLEREPLMAFKAYLDEILAGNEHARIEFKFSSRLHDAITAHEIGMIHSYSGSTGSEPVHGYFKLDSYLVKKNDRWVMIVENQTHQVLTREDWNALN